MRMLVCLLQTLALTLIASPTIAQSRFDFPARRIAGVQGMKPAPTEVSKVEKPRSFETPQIGIQLIESSRYIRAVEARNDYSVTGKGLTAVVLDTGLQTDHEDFHNRIKAQKNYTSDNNGNENDATDGNGHGTNVAGIIAANKVGNIGVHIGIAPEAGIIPIKVLDNVGGGSFASIEKGLKWAYDHRNQHNISVVNMSLGDAGNYTSDGIFANDDILMRIQELTAAKIAVVVSAGNDFFTHSSQEGMGYPAIHRQTISVGAFYDADVGRVSYSSGAIAHTTGPGRITPFSQRLHITSAPDLQTDIFAPGAPLTSSGIGSPTAVSVQHGTSQAAPITTGVILLMQEYYQRQAGELPGVSDLVTWLRRGANAGNDGDDENDNVVNTHKDYPQIDAVGALSAVARSMEIDLLENGATSQFFKNTSN